MVNERLGQGRRDAELEPGDDRGALAEAVLAVARKANHDGEIDALRGRFAPAHVPFAALAEAHGQPIGPGYLLDDGRLAVVVGSPWQRPRVWVATPISTEPLLGVFALGRSSDRRTYALGRADGVHMTEGWGGPTKVVLAWPTAYGPTHADMPVPTLEGRPLVSRLLPLNDGQRVLVVSRSGVFLLDSEGSRLIHPGEQDLDHYVDEDGDDAFPLDLDYVHAAVASDQRYIAAGDQASRHRILDGEGNLVSGVEPALGHPVHAVFSHDGAAIALSARDSDGGRTVRLSMSQIAANLSFAPAPSPSVAAVGPAPVVTSASAYRDGYMFGRADGFVRVCGPDLSSVGELFVGGEVLAIDVAEDQRQIAVCTGAGVVHCIELEPSASDPFAIGTFSHRERRRWIFWRGESSPLIW